MPMRLFCAIFLAMKYAIISVELLRQYAFLPRSLGEGPCYQRWQNLAKPRLVANRVPNGAEEC